MSTLPVSEETGDAELISAVRGGDLSAYGALFERHVDAARRLARQLTSHADADDLVSEAFTKVMKVLQAGGGPDVAFRAYLLTAVRRLHVDRIRATSKLHTTDDMEPFDPGVPFRDTAVEGFENAAAAKAFASLPERWQLVLWHTEVEGQKPAEIAPLLGMSANSVSALAYRAREGLRQAFLNSHAVELEDDQCRWTHEHLGGYVRQGLSKRDSGKVEAHLDECRACMAIYLELTEVNSNLGALLALLLLGSSAGWAYLSGAGSLAAKGGLLLLFGRAKDTLLANTGVAAVGGVAAVTAVAGLSLAVATRGGGESATAEPPAAPVTSQSSTAPDITSPPSQNLPPRTEPPATTFPPTVGPTPPGGPDSTSAAPTEPTPAEADPTDPDSTPAPTDEPTKEPTPTQTPTGPESPPTQTPTDEPTDEPAVHDLELSVSATPVGFGARTRFDVSTSGYPPSGGSATLTIRWSGAPVGVLPRSCSRTGGTEAVCQLNDSSPDLTLGPVLTVATAWATFAVEADGFADSNGDNNDYEWRWSVPGS